MGFGQRISGRKRLTKRILGGQGTAGRNTGASEPVKPANVWGNCSVCDGEVSAISDDSERGYHWPEKCPYCGVIFESY